MELSNEELLPRDKLLRDTFTLAEGFLFGLILMTANVIFWLADPRSYWLLGFFIIAGAMTPILLKTHEHTHPFFVTFLWPKFWLCTAPAWLILVWYIGGLFQQPFQAVTVANQTYISLDMPDHSWLPASTSAATAWPTVLGFCSIYLVTIGLFLVPKSRAFFERLMPYLCLSATLVAVYGYVQAGLGLSKPLLTPGTRAEDFFGFFPYDGHWAAFAILWTCASITIAILTTRYDDSPPFIESSGPWYLTAGTLFGVSAFLVEAHWPSILLMLTYAGMLMLLALHFASNSKDPHRSTITSLSALVSTGMLGAALYRIFGQSADATEITHLREAAWEMFADRPLFGWGMDSFGHLLPYYGSDLLLADNYERAGSDGLQLLAELGVVGLLPIVALLVILFIRYQKGRHDIQLTNHLMVGLVAILALACFDSPLMSPAVFYSFFVLLFVGLRWADVSRSRADEVDAPKPTLVLPESKRRVPFYTTDTEDKLK